MTTPSPPPNVVGPEDPWEVLEKKLDRLFDGKDHNPDERLTVRQAVPGGATVQLEEEQQQQRFRPWSNEQTYFDDPLFVGVGPVTEEPEFVELKIKDKIALVDFFPSFKNGAFQDLALENFLLQWYDRKIGQEDPGLYLRMDIRLGGLLNEVLDIFEAFISQSDIVIRLSAYIGFTLDATAGFQFKQLTFAGALTGVVVCYPVGIPVLTIYSAGVRLRFNNLLKKEKDDDKDKPKSQSTTPGTSGSQASSTGASMGTNPDKKWTDEMAKSTALLDKGTASLDNPAGPVTKQTNPTPVAAKNTAESAFEAEVFGDVRLSLPGDILPLNLQYTATYSKDVVNLTMVLRRGEIWLCPLGVDGLTLVDFIIEAKIPTTKADKGKREMTKSAALDEGFCCEFRGSWAYDTTRVMLHGELYAASQTQKVSFIEGTMKNVTFEDIKKLAKSVHKHDIQKPERDIQFAEIMTLRIEKGRLSLVGQMKIDGKQAQGSVWIGKEGVRITGKMFEWPLGDWMVKEAEIDFIIGKRKKGDTSDPFGGPAKLEDGKEAEGKDGEQKKSDGDEKKDEGEETKKSEPGGGGDKDQDKKTPDSKPTKPQPPPSEPKPSTDPAVDGSAKKGAKDNEGKTTDTGKETAKDKDTEKGAVDKKEPPAAETEWFVGFRVYGDLVIPVTGGNASSPDTGYKLRARVTFSATWTGKKKWQWLFAGKARSYGSLRDIFPEYIEKDGFFDAQLSDFTTFGTNMTEAYVPPEIFPYKITKGFYLTAILDRVPGLEDGKTQPKALKKTTATDRAYLKMGYLDGIPKFAVFLPPSFKLELGDRFYTGALYLDIDPKGKPMFKFFGELYMIMDEGREKPLKLTLELGVDALTGSLGLLMEKADGLCNPLGLGNQVKLYRLGGSIKVAWPVFLSSGTIDTFGITTSIGIEDDKYEATLVLGPNPANSLIKFVAPELDIKQIGRFMISVLDLKDFKMPEVNVISWHNVDVYSSAGITYMGVFYPKGIRVKGEIRIFEWSSTMDAELSLMGFIFKTKMKNFRLGPLVVRGARDEDEEAVLHVELTPFHQLFRLSGKIQIFDFWVLADVHCQLMPKRIFYFNFELVWSAGLYINVKAEMVSPKTMNAPKDADWRLEATIEQTIVAQIKEAIVKTIDSTHEAMQKGIGAAIKAVDDAEADYKRKCEIAKAAVDKLVQENDAKVKAIKKSIAEAIVNLERVKAENAKQRSEADVKYNSEISKGEKERDIKLVPYKSKHQRATGDLNQANSDQPWKVEDATRKRDQARGEFMRVFGDAERRLQSAIDDVARAQRVVDNLDGEVANYNSRCSKQWWRADLHAVRGILRGELAVAKVALMAVEALLRTARDILQSDAFRTLKEAMNSAAETLNSVIDGFKSRIQSLQYIVDQAFKELQAAVQDGNLQFERLKQVAHNIRAKINDELARQEKESQARSELLDRQLQETGLFFQSSAYLTAKSGLDFAQNNNVALITARKTLEGFKKVDEAAYQAVRGFVVDVLDNLVDIQLIHFRGEIKAKKEEQKPFTLIIGGTLGKDKRFLWAVQWMPGQTSALLAELGKRAVAIITGTYKPSSLEEELKVEFKDVKPLAVK